MTLFARALGVGLLVSALAVPCVTGRARADTPCDFVKLGGCSCDALAAGAPVPCPPSHAACQIALPSGFPCPNIPTVNPLTREKVELGRFLFYDTRLSGNQTYACASCHQQDKAFTDGRPQALGSTGESHPRGSMSLANVGYAGTLAWANPKLFTLEDQALLPMFGEHPVELGLAGKEDELLDRLRADPRYQRLFTEAFAAEDEPVSLASITRAIGSFERTLLSGSSAYDRYRVGGEDNAISPSAKRGETLFNDEQRECFHCHEGFNLSDSNDYQDHVAEQPFHNTGLYNLNCPSLGLPMLDLLVCDTTPPAQLCDGTGPQAMGCYPPPNTGIYEITHYDTGDHSEDMGRFKAPTLRNIAVTGPYMHDGSISTLEDVLDHYAAGGRTITDGPYAGVGSANPNKGEFMRGFQLSDGQKADLVHFLQSMTDQEFLTNPHFADPFRTVACPGDCNLDGRIDVSELVTGINISLGTASLGLCVVGDSNADGNVTIDELLHAISGALNGCQ